MLSKPLFVSALAAGVVQILSARVVRVAVCLGMHNAGSSGERRIYVWWKLHY